MSYQKSCLTLWISQSYICWNCSIVSYDNQPNHHLPRYDLQTKFNPCSGILHDILQQRRLSHSCSGQGGALPQIPHTCIGFGSSVLWLSSLGSVWRLGWKRSWIFCSTLRHSPKMVRTSTILPWYFPLSTNPSSP